MFSDHNWIKVEINVKKIFHLYKNSLSNNSWVKGQTQTKVAEFLDNNNNENITYQNLWVQIKQQSEKSSLPQNTYTKNKGKN